MTVSEKHINAAKALIEDRINSMCLTWDHSFGLMDEAQREGLRRSFRQIAYHDLTPFIAAALTAAEREGREDERKRCAEIARDLPRCELTSVSPSGGITPKMAFGVGADAQSSAIEKSILSQANTHSVALPPPGATEAGSVQPSADPATHHASRNGEG